MPPVNLHVSKQAWLQGKQKMAIATMNLATGELLKTFEPLSDSQIDEKIGRAGARTGFASLPISRRRGSRARVSRVATSAQRLPDQTFIHP